MKFRSTAVYLLILLVIGAVYAGMRVEKQKAARKKEQASRVFTFAPKSVKQIEIESAQNKAICLKKTSKWAISSPIVSQVDNMQLTGLLSSLHHVRMERKIGKESGNLKAFGLDKPSLVVRFLTGDKWHELETGAKNPVATDRYAMADKNGEVFLISSQAYDDLNKNLTDLRRKELFSWKPGQVKAFEISWRNGDEVDIVRQGDTGLWKSKSQPKLELSIDKVANLLEGLHWLRASDFLAKGAMPATPDVDVKVQLKDGKTAELKVALPAPGQKQAIATSSELQSPVLLSTYFLSSIPHSADALVDRALVSSVPSEINKITWKTPNGSGDLVRKGTDNWGSVEGKAAPKTLKNSWQVETFLAFMHNTQYIGTAGSAGTPPQGAPNSLQFVNAFGKKTSLTWNAPDPKTTGPVDAWLEKNGLVMQVQVKRQDIQRIGESLARMSPTESAAPEKKGANAQKGVSTKREANTK